MACNIYQHSNPVTSAITPILQVRKPRQRELRSLLMVISLKVAVPGFEPRQFSVSLPKGGCVLERALYLKLGNGMGPGPTTS